MALVKHDILGQERSRQKFIYLSLDDVGSSTSITLIFVRTQAEASDFIKVATDTSILCDFDEAVIENASHASSSNKI